MRLRTPATVIATALLLASAAGCGSDANPSSAQDPNAQDPSALEPSTGSANPTPSDAPATPTPSADGVSLRTDGFAMMLPKGWQEITAQVNSPTIVLAAVDRNETDERPSTVKVEHPRTAPTNSTELANVARQVLRKSGATKIKPAADRTACGLPAVALTGVTTEPGSERTLTHYAVTAGSGTAEQTWLITFSTSKWLADKDFKAFVTDPIATCSIDAS